MVPSSITPAAIQAPVRSPLKRCSSAALTSSLLIAKAGVAQNMTAEKKKSCALMISRNSSFRTTAPAQPNMSIVLADPAAYYCAPPIKTVVTTHRARLRAHRAPGIPALSDWRARKLDSKTSGGLRREIVKLCLADTRCLKIEFGSMRDDRHLLGRLLRRPLSSANPQRENARGERAFSVVDLG